MQIPILDSKELPVYSSNPPIIYVVHYNLVHHEGQPEKCVAIHTQVKVINLPVC